MVIIKTAISIFFEALTSKAIQIVIDTDEYMKKHRAPHPVMAEMVEGKLDLGVRIPFTI